MKSANYLFFKANLGLPTKRSFLLMWQFILEIEPSDCPTLARLEKLRFFSPHPGSGPQSRSASPSNVFHFTYLLEFLLDSSIIILDMPYL